LWLAKIVPLVTLNWCRHTLHFQMRRGRVGIDGGAFAFRAVGSAAIGAEPDRYEPLMRLGVGHPANAREAQFAGGGGKEEVLGHVESALTIFVNVTCNASYWGVSTIIVCLDTKTLGE
jgi:hypothetical protein